MSWTNLIEPKLHFYKWLGSATSIDLLATQTSEQDLQWIGFVFSISLVLVLVGTLIFRMWRKIVPRKRATRKKPAPPLPEFRPPDFTSRLNSYVENSLGAKSNSGNSKTEEIPFRSSMRFWSIVQVLKRVPPKSADSIRRVLMRIRQILK